MKYRIESDESVTDAVLEATRRYEGCESAPEKPLYEVVDPDALDALFSPVDAETPRARGRVSFTYGQCLVTIEHGESLTVDSIEESSSLA